LVGELAGAFTHGYMLSDLFHLVVYLSPATSDAYYASILHHFSFIIIEPFLLASGALTQPTVIRLFAEISTPFVNFRWMLAAAGFKASKWYFYNGLALLVTFFVSRILMLPYVYTTMLLNPDVKGMERLGYRRWFLFGTGVVDILNIYWFYRIMCGTIKHLFPRARLRANSVDDHEQ